MAGESFRRLHPVSLLFSLAHVLRAFLLPAILLLVVGRGEGFEGWIAWLALPAAAAALIRYLSLRYRMGDRELVIRTGILHRRERHVPYDHIHSLDTSRTLIHRALGVADVSVQTASGADPEATFRVLSQSAVEEMRRRVFAGREEYSQGTLDQGFPADAVVASDTTTVSHARPWDLVVYGIISNRGLVALAAVLGLLWQLELMPSDLWWSDHIRSLPGLAPHSLMATVVIGVSGLVAAIVVLRMLSVAWALVSLWDFRLTRRGDELRTRYGMVTQRSATIPRHRIQIVTVDESLLHRLFGRASLHARTAGATQPDQSGGGRDWLFPVARTADVAALLDLVHPDLDPDSVQWTGLHRRAWRRMAVRWLAVVAVVALVVGWRWPWLAAVGLPVAVVVVGAARVRARHCQWSVTNDAVWWRRGWPGRTLRVVRCAKIQAVAMTESPFDRRHRMASLEVDTANAGVGRAAIRIPYLDREVADRLRERLGQEAAGTRFRW